MTFTLDFQTLQPFRNFRILFRKVDRSYASTNCLDFQGQNLKKSYISGMGWPIDLERKGCESIGCYTHFVTLNVHFTHDLDLGFQGQILKILYLRNGRADWHGTKGMWVDRMLDSHCDFKLWPHPWPWPWIFKVEYWNCCNLGMGGSTLLEWKGCELDMMLDAQWDWPWATVHGK